MSFQTRKETASNRGRCTLELANFSLELLDALGLTRGCPGPLPGIDLGLLRPPPKGVSINAGALADPDHRRVQRQLRILTTGFLHEPDGSFPQLQRILP
ncbi:potassium channel subfamily T member 1 [Microcella alkaliphila]|uniref:Potassium channel subfamily T member 1 n=1 Tax=Microcella alkaliphila TaxID=279828 RepID=A0A0U4X0K1_9MICO|nr:potassium channel subfamily T member 1 [Microcella alkaliphila]